MPLHTLSAKRTAESKSVAELLKLAESLTGALLKDGIISSGEAEVVEYGLENIGSDLSGMLVTLMTGICFGCLSESMVLWMLIYPLRRNAGGFHAKTKLKCLFVSVGMLIIVFLLFIRRNWTAELYLAAGAVCFLLIFLLAPVGNPNKLLDEKEHKVYQKRSRIVLTLEGILLVLAYCCRWTSLLAVTVSCFFMVGTSLLAGRMNLKHRTDKKSNV